jgi:hypothetical protein
MRRADSEDGPAFVFDPLADLFFSVVAIVVLAVIIILPTVRLQAFQAKPDSPPNFEIDGRTATAIRATAAGLILGSTGETRVALDAIGDDAVLTATLGRTVQAGAPLVVLVEPDGDEADFQLEPMLARAGVKSVTKVRLDPSCDHMRQRTETASCRVLASTGKAP